MRRIDRRQPGRLVRKRLFEVTVWDDRDPHAGTNTLIALADDEVDVCNLAIFESAEIVTLVALPGRVAASEPSRVLGSARTTWSPRRGP